MTTFKTTGGNRIDVKTTVENDKAIISLTINGTKENLTPEVALSLATHLSELSKKAKSRELENIIQKPKYWSDYLLEAPSKNVDSSLIEVEGVVWLIDHESIRDFVDDYSMDKYSQMTEDLDRLSDNGLVSLYLK